MPTPSQSADLLRRRTHNLLLISKLLSQRDHTSPFTLILDSLEQTAKPLLAEYARRAKISKCRSIFLSFETVRQPSDIDVIISCWDRRPSDISQAVSTAISQASTASRVLILIDSLSPLVLLTSDTKTGASFNLTAFLSSLLAPDPATKGLQVSLVAVYHRDIPIYTEPSSHAPSPLSLLTYLATTVLTVHSLPNLLAVKQAQDRSVSIPSFGLDEEVEGILLSLKSNLREIKSEQRGIVIEMEHRRKSGRGVHEWFFLPASSTAVAKGQRADSKMFRETLTLLADHPLFKKDGESDSVSDLTDMTFDLGLTDRQRLEREGVVLPYFDAQKAAATGLGGPGEGGRILYDMGAEDDFDDEEDEI